MIKEIQYYLSKTNITEESIYFLDISELDRLYNLWKSEFTGIHPYYAIKCNPNIEIVRRLANLGCNFDCASMIEIDLVLGLGISPNRIIFANPCKRKKDIVSAYKKGITATTFDTPNELYKIWEVAPKMDCILRIYANDPEARCQLSNKFGCMENDWTIILERAKNLQMNITGISFHVGSGAKSPSAFKNAIETARRFYDVATSSHYGHKIGIIDIGGGFSSATSSIPQTVGEALETFFPKDLNCSYIAEPGRFFAESVGYLATNIIGIKNSSVNSKDYWITDSIYGSFNCILYDHYEPPIVEELLCKKNTKRFKSVLYGPTCDGMDKIATIDDFPEQSLGNWIVFKNMGAYTLAGACNFNGIPFKNPHLVYL